MHTRTIAIETASRDAMLDVTARVMEVVDASGVKEGWVHVFVPHTTAGVTINENADPDVIHDVLKQLDVMVPRDQAFYRHSEGNSASHVKSSMMGCSLIVPLEDGVVALGRWQSIFFCEFDGPRTRRLRISVSDG
jgi:secondary thiamine-phosphate synthase enzyme